MEFYVFKDNHLQGPFTARQLHDMVVAQQLDPSLLCAPDGAQEWKSIGEVLSPVMPSPEEPDKSTELQSSGLPTISHPALAAQALGFLSLLCLGMVVLHRQAGFYALAALAVPAVIAGAWALVQIRRRGNGMAGNGLALGGIFAAVASLIAGAWLVFQVFPGETGPKKSAESTQVPKEN
tara:strand:- start:536 stop:1072 length:537 start_codon:yes stop_codon:yes gene_type:complete